MMKNLLIDLPEDLFINNILLSKVLLLPIKSLLSLRCVCKYLRNLITSPAFINMHLLLLLHRSTTASSPNHQQLNNQLVLIDSNTSDHVCYSLKFNDGGGTSGDPCRPEEVIMFDYPIKSPTIWGSCNGLLCLTGYERRNIVCLWNPSTKEYKELPSITLQSSTEIIPIGMITKSRVSIINYGLGYDRLNDDYKIFSSEIFFVATNDGDHFFITEFQVYTLGTNTWRKINNPNKEYNFVTRPKQSMVFVNGALHWIMSKSFKMRNSETLIVSFDIEKEVFGEIQKPLLISKLDDNFSLKIHVLRDCLCLFNNSGNIGCCFNVWMMMDYGVKESWTKLFTIDRKELLGSCYYSIVTLLRFCENGEILIGTYNTTTLIAYDPMNNKARRVEFGQSVKQSEIYIESLVSLNSGVYKGWGEGRIRSKMNKMSSLD